MTYLARLVARALGDGRDGLDPRRPSRYETPREVEPDRPAGADPEPIGPGPPTPPHRDAVGTAPLPTDAEVVPAPGQPVASLSDIGADETPADPGGQPAGHRRRPGPAPDAAPRTLPRRAPPAATGAPFHDEPPSDTPTRTPVRDEPSPAATAPFDTVTPTALAAKAADAPEPVAELAVFAFSGIAGAHPGSGPRAAVSPPRPAAGVPWRAAAGAPPAAEPASDTGDTGDTATFVEVTIGRIEVRAADAPPPSRSARRRPQPPLALEQYLERRRVAARGQGTAGTGADR